MNKVYTTSSAAEVLGVSEATIKRWADAGLLKCARTPGGHRKFDAPDVLGFLIAPGPEVATAPLPPHRLDAAQIEARALMLRGDAERLVSIITVRRAADSTVAQVLDDVIAPALNDIGDCWAAGTLTAAEEHLASNTVIDTLARVRPMTTRFPPAGERALSACMADEQHDIGARMVALVLGELGYEASTLGANVPVGALALMVARMRPAIVALSASPRASIDRLRGDLAILATAARAARTRLVVGGPGFMRLGQLPGEATCHARLADLLHAHSKRPPRPRRPDDPAS